MRALVANLRCRSETCCTRLAENTMQKKSPKIAIWAPSHEFVGLYLELEMWANVQRDGRPAEYKWRPLFNAAKFS